MIVAIVLLAVAAIVFAVELVSRRRAPVSPFPPVTDTVAGFADRTRDSRLSEPYDWTTDDGPDAA